MNLIRRSAWVAVMLGAAVGCSSEEGGSTPSNAPAPSPSMAPKTPVVPAKGQTEAAKGGASKETQPPAAKPDESKKGEASPKLEGPKTDAGKGDSAAVKLTPGEIATIKQLPAADQELALKQAVCPVSDGHLGSEDMGKPYKVTVAGRTVFLCCDGCEDKLKADPKKYFAKLDAQAGKK